MFDFTQKNKGLNVYFATVEPNSETGHYIYISGYGQTVAEKLNKYAETHIADDEDEEKLFEKWDDLITKAKSEVGFKAIDEFEEGYIYVTTFQNGVGISEEDEAGSKRYTSRGRKRKAKISIINPEMSEGLEVEEDDNSFDIGENLDDVDIDDDE